MIQIERGIQFRKLKGHPLSLSPERKFIILTYRLVDDCLIQANFNKSHFITWPWKILVLRIRLINFDMDPGIRLSE